MNRISLRGNFKSWTVLKHPRSYLSRLSAPGVCLLAAWCCIPAAAAAQVDLEGTWYVLVHYTDQNVTNREQMRWDDRVWTFKRSRSQLKWRQHPIVVFSDGVGRFERRVTGQYARVLGGWEPNETQARNIQTGLRVNSRGVKQKSLRGSDQGGWRTGTRRRVASALSMTYQDDWSIQSLGALPVFEQSDGVGSSEDENLEGTTVYRTEAVETGGNVLVGSYDRDGTRRGTFRMTRSGPTRGLEKRDQREIQLEAYRRSGRAVNWNLGGPTRVDRVGGDGAAGADAPPFDGIQQTVDHWYRLEEEARSVVNAALIARNLDPAAPEQAGLLEEALELLHDGGERESVRKQIDTRLAEKYGAPH